MARSLDSSVTMLRGVGTVGMQLNRGAEYGGKRRWEAVHRNSIKKKEERKKKRKGTRNNKLPKNARGESKRVYKKILEKTTLQM
jgi:hypothetical protein